MNRSELMTRAAVWIQARGWKTKLAKKRGSEQSLFEHSLIELDVLLELLPILEQPQHYGLDETENPTAIKAFLIKAFLVHDMRSVVL